ncbi:MAG: hypothetical protein AB1646_09605 [Thermodesulfobacteriota bacterium]
MSGIRVVSVVVVVTLVALGAMVVVCAQTGWDDKAVGEGLKRLDNAVKRLLNSPSATVTCEAADVSLAAETAVTAFKKVSIVDPVHGLELKCESLRVKAPRDRLTKGTSTPGQAPQAIEVEIEALHVKGPKDVPGFKADRIMLEAREWEPGIGASDAGPTTRRGIGALMSFLSADDAKEDADPTLLPLSDQSAVLTIQGLKTEHAEIFREFMEVEPAHLDRMTRTDKMVLHAYYRAGIKECDIRLKELVAPTGRASGSVVVRYGPDARTFAEMPARVTFALKSEGSQDPRVTWLTKTGPGRKARFSVGRATLDTKLDLEFDRAAGQPVDLPKGHLLVQIEDLAFQDLKVSPDSGQSEVLREISLGKMEFSYNSVEDRVSVRWGNEKFGFKDVPARIDLTFGEAAVGLQAKMRPEDYRSADTFFTKCPSSVEVSLTQAKLSMPLVAMLLRTDPELAAKITQIDEAKLKSSFVPQFNEWSLKVEKLSGPLFSMVAEAKTRWTKNPFLQEQMGNRGQGQSVSKGSFRVELDVNPGGHAFGDSARTGTYALAKGSLRADVDYDSRGASSFNLDNLRLRASTRLETLKAAFSGPLKEWLETKPAAKLLMTDTGGLHVDEFQGFVDLDKRNLEIFRTKVAAPALTAALTAGVDLDPVSAGRSVVKSSELRVSNFDERTRAYLENLVVWPGGLLPEEAGSVLLEATGPLNNLQLKGFLGTTK